jgi:beta-lactamase class A
MPAGKTIVTISFIVLSLLSAFTANARIDRLKNKLETIAAAHNATVGICIRGPQPADTLSINGSRHFPMQSVYKFPIALAVLHAVDKGKLSLSQKITITQSELRPGTWSPIREKYPDGTTMQLSELLGYSVSQSDNNGCDILIRMAGGTAKVNDYIHSTGVKQMAIAATEAEMAQAWDVQFTNWSAPRAMVQLLQLFYNGKILSAGSRAFLLKMMTETSTGPNRLKGLLPAGATVAHKTGTSNTNDAGVTAATNDVGFISLPGGKLLTIAVFITGSHEGVTGNEQIIAAIAKATWDYFMNEGN